MGFLLEATIGFDNLLRLCLECWWLGDPISYEIRYPPCHFSLKTVHRTVFLTLEHKGSNPLFIHFQKKNPSVWMGFLLEATIGFEPMNQGFADPRLTTWLCRHIDFFDKNRTQETGRILCPVFYGADDEARTRYLHLGKVALYQMSYIRILVVPPIGIEPMTRGFSVLCSTN